MWSRHATYGRINSIVSSRLPLSRQVSSKPKWVSKPSWNTNFPSSVQIYEVGPRDGLQNEIKIPLDTKIELVNRLSRTGLQVVEAGSFVSPKWVPQMKATGEVLSGIDRVEGVRYPVLTPNVKGMERAIECNVKEVAIFASASESFSLKNINCTIADSLRRYKEVCDLAHQHGIRVRGYVSCVVGCPYEGYVDPAAVARVTQQVFDLGCYEVSLGDTIGIGTPTTTYDMLREVTRVVAVDRLALHCHDTYGQALANILVALQEFGLSVIDSSVGGLGGCPYAVGASGNVATEDVVYMLHGMGIRTGVDLDALARVSAWISRTTGIPNKSKVSVAHAAEVKEMEDVIGGSELRDLEQKFQIE